MESAATARFYEALSLAHEYPTEALASAYLMGYTAECLLKSAYGRILGLPSVQPIYTHLVGSGLTGRRLHDLHALLELCFVSRSIPLTTLEMSAFRKNVTSVQQNHSVLLRYKSFPVNLQELSEIYESVDWIRANHTVLWS